jgi:aspartate ammonia-lyase
MMPGKVNPVLLEAAIQTGLLAIANDLLVTEAAARASLQIDEFLPLLAASLLESLEILVAIDLKLAAHIDGVQADEARCRFYFDRSRMIVTAFVPWLGYDRCQALVQEFDASGRDDLRAFLIDRLGRADVERILAPHNLMALGYKK